MRTEIEDVRTNAAAEMDQVRGELSESQALAQAQAVELAQVRERLAASEQTNRADTEKHAVALASLKATAEKDLHHAREEARNCQLQIEQVNGLLAQTKKDSELARKQSADA